MLFLIFFLLHSETWGTDFVLSSPKCTLSLLFTNQSHILQKFIIIIVYLFIIIIIIIIITIMG